MARRRSKSNPDRQLVRAGAALLAAFLKLPWKARVALVALVLVVGLVVAAVYYLTRPAAPTYPPGAKVVVLCVWNLENLFDDRDDRRRQPDEDFDNWFVADPAAREQKYRRLAEALLRLNNGIGPDVIAGNEVESYRAAELLKDELNAQLPAGALRYEFVAMKELDAGRHIAPCVISRYPLSRAKLLGRRQRILQVTVSVNGHDLTLVAAHWTSQLSDQGEDETRGRFAYADTIYAAYAAEVRANPRADYVVCGDFNDPPDADPVAKNLRLTGDANLVTPDANPPLLFGPLSNKSPDLYGTYYYSRPLIYDQVGLSAGMLDDEGWSYVPGSVRVPTDGLIRSGSRTRRPWRFGTKTDDAVGRGYSDHFPVVVTLKVAP
jgi:endonuclease/exonuclease/phosphatase family metal-dependent hydrolase